MADRPRVAAIMQPYFVPYAGYFRLMAAADVFVLYDCVQFPRRGYVHRNKLRRVDGELDWLSLPLAPASRETLIRDLAFREDRADWFKEAARRFPAIGAPSFSAAPLVAALGEGLAQGARPVDVISGLVRLTTETLGIACEFLCSSDLDIAPDLRGEERIIAIATAVGATAYVNAPGGRALYDAERFAEAGLKLSFLTDYEGPTASILQRLQDEDAANIGAQLSDGAEHFTN